MLTAAGHAELVIQVRLGGGLSFCGLSTSEASRAVETTNVTPHPQQVVIP